MFDIEVQIKASPQLMDSIAQLSRIYSPKKICSLAAIFTKVTLGTVNNGFIQMTPSIRYMADLSRVQEGQANEKRGGSRI